MNAFEMLLNTNSESLQTHYYDHYKCLVQNKNGLRLVTNMLQMVTNMLRICFPGEFIEHVPDIRNTSKASANANDRLRMPKAITLR